MIQNVYDNIYKKIGKKGVRKDYINYLKHSIKEKMLIKKLLKKTEFYQLKSYEKAMFLSTTYHIEFRKIILEFKYDVAGGGISGIITNI